MASGWRWLGVALVVAVGGCDEAAAPPDGSSDAADGGGPSTSVQAPAPPAAPVLTPCPDGWREVEVAGVASCEPWPETGPPACVPGTMALPGVDGCAPLGAACTTDDLPEEPASGGPFVYVLADATGGDGSRLAPFGTIGEAMAFASPGSTLLLGAGTYDELVNPKQGVTLRGLCPRRTILTRTDTSPGEAVVVVTRDGVTIRDLTIAGAPRVFGLTARRVTARIEGVVFEDIGAPGLGVADGGMVTLVGSMIRRCAHGIEVIGSGRVDVEGSAIMDNAGPGIVAIGGAVAAVGSWVADNRNVSEPGFGALAQDGGTVTFDRSVLSGNADVGLTAGGGGSIEARDTMIAEQRTDPSGDAGFGVEAESGSSVLLERVTLRANRMGGIFVQGAGTTLDASHVIVRDTRSRDDGQFGRGLVVQDGASAVMRRSVITESLDTGVLLSGRLGPASLRLEDVEVRDTRPQQSDGEAGRAMSAQYEVSLELERVRVRGAHGIGLHVAGRDGSSPTATLFDLEVSDVMPEEELGIRDLHGRGLQLEVGATVTGQRIRIERTHEAGLVAFEATVDLADVAILDTLPRVSDETIGRAVVVQGGATLTLDGAHVELTRGTGVYVSNPGSRLSATRMTLRDARPRGCAQTHCADAPAGHGVGIYDGASADIDEFEIAEAALCGVHVATGGALDLHRGVIRGAAFGACVQVDGYDVDRLSDDVAYEDNGVNLESTTLPVPSPLDGLEL